MRTIFKYPLPLDSWRQSIELPKGGQPLSVQVQNGELCLWALIDTEAETASYQVKIYGTGHEVDDMPIGYEFLGTVQLHSGALVVHLFGYFE